MTDSHGFLNGNDGQRDARGRFANFAGPGRPQGSPDAASWATLRAKVVAAGTEHISEVLETLRETDPKGFATVVSKFMPRADQLELTSSQRTLAVVLSREPDPSETLALIQRCLSIADGEPLERKHVIAAMKQGENHG